ncbi:MAG: transketolase, partial [Acidimicrobiia bacterium]|nr:transketolase [Acidimicrobiia bacterium]
MTPDQHVRAVSTIKGLVIDAVQKANSGHPGMPMGMADLAVVLWSEFLTVNPDQPEWHDRDRFVLSNGHGSMLLYSLLHLAGFPLTLDDIKSFRQWGSHTAGHPERDTKLGIEMTTGPLGQGFGTGVGLALAEAHLRARVGAELVDHRTWGFVSDGDLMEGISYESASVAGHLGLGKLIYVFDDNKISIDGSIDMAFSEDVAKRFDALGWHTVEIDGHDPQAIREGLTTSVEIEDKPSLILAHTHIGHGSPHKQDTSAAHGSPLGDAEIKLVKEAMGWPTDETFTVPTDVVESFTAAMRRGRRASETWTERKAAASAEVLELWENLHSSEPIRLVAPDFGEKIATRSATGKIFDQIAQKVPGFLGGAADLVGSTKTHISSDVYMTSDDLSQRNIAFGIREHAMATIVNGLTIHGGLRAYGATFFVFSDYMRPALRLSALMGAPSIWNFSHDSIFLGEDGPTHQPIEQLASLRAMPDMWVIRPADAGETVEAWELALNRTDGPTCILTSRQDLPVLDRSGLEGSVAKGGYVLRDGTDVVLIGTGSEVSLALEASNILASEGISARVVSLPCWELFFAQDEAYRAGVLGTDLLRVS